MMAKEKILVVDDEEDILELVKFNLSREGYQVVCTGSGEKALKITKRDIPDLIVLDLMLPGMDGFEVASRLNQDPVTKDIPIVMLTAKTEESDVVAGLELGADDYITKPFSPRVLAARVKAVIRRQPKGSPKENSAIRIQNVVIYPERHEVFVDGKPVKLTFTEFGILTVLAKKSGWVFSRSQIIDAVRGDDHFVNERSVDVQILGLRKKLGEAGKYIETVRGVGYRIND
jgi:two-component system phosphate regulon response regulator PhoB